jgi:hypothetical protein
MNEIGPVRPKRQTRVRLYADVLGTIFEAPEAEGPAAAAPVADGGKRPDPV